MEHKTVAKRGIGARSMEIAVGLIALALGLLVAIGSYRLGATWEEHGPGAGYFPFYIGVLICIGSAVNLALAFRVPGTRIFVEWEALGRVLSVVLPAALFIAGIHIVGIYVSSLIYIAGFMLWLGKYSWHRSVGVAFGVSLALFLMFEVWFQVPLPKGAYNVLGYFGY